jgi:hypothetical protein
LTLPTGGDKTTTMLCRLTTLVTYRWSKGRCCDKVTTTLSFSPAELSELTEVLLRLDDVAGRLII